MHVEPSLLIDPFDKTGLSTSHLCTDLPLKARRIGMCLPGFVFHFISLMYVFAFKTNFDFWCKNENYAHSIFCKKQDKGNRRNYCLLRNGNHYLSTVITAPFLSALWSVSSPSQQLSTDFPFCLSFQSLIVWLKLYVFKWFLANSPLPVTFQFKVCLNCCSVFSLKFHHWYFFFDLFLRKADFPWFAALFFFLSKTIQRSLWQCLVTSQHICKKD